VLPAYPLVKHGFDRFYGRTSSATAPRIKQARQPGQAGPGRRLRPAGPPRPTTGPTPPHAAPAAEKAGALEVYALDVDQDVPVTDNKPELTDAEREKLLKDTVLIKDERDPQPRPRSRTTRRSGWSWSTRPTPGCTRCWRSRASSTRWWSSPTRTPAAGGRTSAWSSARTPRGTGRTPPDEPVGQVVRLPDPGRLEEVRRGPGRGRLAQEGRHLRRRPRERVGHLPVQGQGELRRGRLQGRVEGLLVRRSSAGCTIQAGAAPGLGGRVLSWDAKVYINDRKGSGCGRSTASCRSPTATRSSRSPTRPSRRRTTTDTCLGCCSPAESSTNEGLGATSRSAGQPGRRPAHAAQAGGLREAQAPRPRRARSW
jgi:hypothetical protein